MVRQRDLFRKLLQDSAGGPAGAAAAAAAAGAITLRPEAISTPPRVEVGNCTIFRLQQRCISFHMWSKVQSQASQFDSFRVLQEIEGLASAVAKEAETFQDLD